MLRNPKLQRATGMAVSALLAANVLVLVLGLGDDAAVETPATITYIVGEDGSTVAVDPSTAEGQRAIAEAEARGNDVVTSAVEDAPDGLVPPSSSTSSRSSGASTTAPGGQPQVAPSGGGITVPTVPGLPGLPELPDDAGELVDDTLTTVVETIDDLGDDVDSAVDGATDIVDDNAGTDTGSTVDPVVDEVTDTVTTTVSTIVDTVTETTPDVPVPDVTEPLDPLSGSGAGGGLPDLGL